MTASTPTHGGATPGNDYAGDVDVKRAWDAMAQESGATLVDVRTKAEWTYVGLPDLGDLGREPLLAEWQVFPTMSRNPTFEADLAAALAARGVGRDTPVFFLCRSGARSRAAAIAMTQAGYTRCFNIAGGFEGDPDGEGHRGNVNGWKASGLPWRQG